MNTELEQFVKEHLDTINKHPELLEFARILGCEIWLSIENIKKDGDDEMMETEKNCTRVVYTKGREVHTLLGLLLEENSIYVSLKTRKRVYKIMC